MVPMLMFMFNDVEASINPNVFTQLYNAGKAKEATGDH